jgi:hypothetical protein
MKSVLKLVPIICIFSIAFFLLREFGGYIGYNIGALVSDVGGLAYLYSTVGTLFAIFAAFVIVSESQDWNALNSASKDEVRDLNELLLWSTSLSKSLSARWSQAIRRYLEAVIEKEWESLKMGHTSREAELALSAFHGLLIDASKEKKDVGSRMFTIFNELLNHRSIRVEYSWQPLPMILKFTIVLVDIAVVVLSLFIGVKDLWLDYIFMVCIVTLGSVILIVVDDLDNPLRPGEWWLTSDNYKRLFSSIRMLKRDDEEMPRATA